MSMEMELLARETLKLSVRLRELDGFEDLFERGDDFFLRSEEKSALTAPAAPGLLYRIEKASHTFCIRAIASSNLQFRAQQLQRKSDLSMYAQLRLEQSDSLQDIAYFITQNLDQANKLYSALMNRRFPCEEDLLCNLSDPGFSWWLEDHGNGLTIYFKSHGIERVQRLTQLGPIGDHKKARIYFNQAYRVFSLLFPVLNFNCCSKSMHISTSDPSSEAFTMLKDIFLKGRNGFANDYPFNGAIYNEFWHYLDELALFRRFWIEIGEKLAEKSEQQYLQ